MQKTILIVTALLFFITRPVSAGEVTDMAECAVKIFTEIHKTRKWSGKPPVGCQAYIAVEKRQDGIFVTAWTISGSSNGWARTSLTGAMSYAEIAAAKELARAGSDIAKRAARLERCLDSINSVNDPLDCRDHATKSYLAGEVSGTENQRLIWLDDNGRHVVAEYSFGNTTPTRSPPAELFNGQRLPPGIIINLYRK